MQADLNEVCPLKQVYLSSVIYLSKMKVFGFQQLLLRFLFVLKTFNQDAFFPNCFLLGIEPLASDNRPTIMVEGCGGYVNLSESFITQRGSIYLEVIIIFTLLMKI